MPLSKMATTFSLIVAAAAPVPAQSAGRHHGAGAPAAGRQARYCLRVEPVTGTLVERVRCWTRARWIAQGVDVDKEWAREGVTVIE
jgi:hypothetical protein